MSTHPTPHRYLGTGATAQLAQALAGHLPGKKLLVTCDDMTWEVAGAAVQAQLDGATIHSFGKRIRAELPHAEALAEKAKKYDTLLAIGSGTVNDLTKYAAATAGKPYAIIATACSMNGYTSANASLEMLEAKKSFAARPPVFVIGDTDILANAPKRLTRAGLGDTLCRSTVEADMLLSHHLFDTPYPRELFDVLRGHEEKLLPGIMNNRDSERDFIESLFLALLDAGDAMTSYGSSAVASQGEHMIAHTLELKYGSELRELLHGELVALATLTMSRLQQRAVLSTPAIKPMVYDMEQFQRIFGKQHAEELAAIYSKKLVSNEKADALNQRLAHEWPAICAELLQVMLPTNTIERALIHSGCNVKPEQVGLAEERYRFAISYAHLTRERFTFLDIAAMNMQRLR
jgi:glycerol-1-phosphate dehydrogenase [NAD(P)+]